MNSLRLYGEPYRGQNRGRRDETPVSRQRRGGSSTRETPRAGTRSTGRCAGSGTVREPRHNSDQYMVLGCLPSAPLSETNQYLGGRKRWPVRSPVKPSQTDELFAALRRAVPRPKPREARQNAWILAETWRLIDERVSARRDPRYGTLYRWWMGKAVQASLAADRRRRAEEPGAEVEALVKADPPLIQEAWYRLQGWYKAAVDRAPPPARATLRWVTAERSTAALYHP